MTWPVIAAIARLSLLLSLLLTLLLQYNKEHIRKSFPCLQRSAHLLHLATGLLHLATESNLPGLMRKLSPLEDVWKGSGS